MDVPTLEILEARVAEGRRLCNSIDDLHASIALLEGSRPVVVELNFTVGGQHIPTPQPQDYLKELLLEECNVALAKATAELEAL